MSKAQRDIYNNMLPGSQLCNSYILSSVFDESFFDTIEEIDGKKERSGWIVLGSDSWVKGTAQSEDQCKEKGYEFEVVTGLNPRSFLERLSESEGICFHPSGYDTCPRFVIEAKLLGCQLDLNENVQHKNEEWFNLDRDDMVSYLKSRPSFFWDKAF